MYNNKTKFFSKILITMLNLFDKKTKNSSPDISKLNFFSATAKDTALTSNKNINGETRHYPPATKE